MKISQNFVAFSEYINFKTEVEENIWKIKEKNSLCRGIEPRSPAWQAGILTTILTKIVVTWVKKLESIWFLEHEIKQHWRMKLWIQKQANIN